MNAARMRRKISLRTLREGVSVFRSLYVMNLRIKQFRTDV